MNDALTKTQVRKLLSVVNISSIFGRRDYLLILFFYHTGLRVSELSGLTLSLVCNEEGEPKDFLHLPAAICKGRKARIVPLNATAKRCVQKLFSILRILGVETEETTPVFINTKKRALSVRRIQQLIKGYREKANLSICATPHTFRRTSATQLAQAGVPTNVIQAYLGHRHLSTTQLYLSTTPHQLQAALSQLG